MDTFPNLLLNQFAVLMAEGATGIILTIKGERCVNDEGEVYVLFDDLATARQYIDIKQRENDTWEFWIYNSQNEVIELWEALKWKR